MPTNDYAAYFPGQNTERTEAEERENSEAVASLPVIRDVLEWFDKQIEDLKNPLLITGVTVKSDAESVKAQILLAQALIHDYKMKRDDFKIVFSKYIQESDAA